METLVLAWGTSASDRRKSRVAALRRVADDLRPISAAVYAHSHMGPSVAIVAANVNSASMAVLVDALGWLDTTITQRFVEGFPIVGEVTDSGVYRRIRRPRADPEEHAEKLSSFRDTAGEWNANLMRGLARGSGDEADAAVAGKTRTENSKGLVVGSYLSVGALAQRMRAMFPHARDGSTAPRLMKRFGIAQKGSVKAIDDARSNGANGATRMHETFATPSFAYPAVVAIAVAAAAACHGAGVPRMSVAMLDLRAAYRSIPTAQPWWTAFAIHNPLASPPRAEIYLVPGHNFGLVSAVVNFNRFPELVTIAMRAIFAAPMEHYFDDFILPDLAAAGDSGTLIL